MWNPIASVHEHARGFAIGPADAKAKMEVARELPHLVARCEWIFSCERDEFDIASGVFLPHFLVVRNFTTTWSTPGGPDVDDDHFAAEVRKAESAVVDRLQFVIE